MYVPLCAVALTDVYKLPSDGGSGSSHINHCRRRVPHFQSSSAALTASFFSHPLPPLPPLTGGNQRGFLFLISVTWKLFSNNSQMPLLVVLFLSSQGVTCCAVFSSVWLGPPPRQSPRSHELSDSELSAHKSSLIKVQVRLEGLLGSEVQLVDRLFPLPVFFFFLRGGVHRKHLKVGRASLLQSWPLRMSLQVNVYAALG